MRHFFYLFLHEVRMLFITPATYAASVLFLLIMGGIYLLGLEQVSRGIQGESPTESFFQLFWLPVFFMVPLLTMRSIAEERRLGTLEAIMTTPATAMQVVLSKFLAAYLFYLSLWGLTLFFPYFSTTVLAGSQFGSQLMDGAHLKGGYSFVALSGCLYIAIGLFASSLTRSQLVAGMLSFSMLFVLIISGQVLLNTPLLDGFQIPWLADPVDYIRTFKHLEDFSRGVIDSRPFFLYLSTALLFLGVTTLVVESKA